MWRSEKFSSRENLLRINIAGNCSASGSWVLCGYTEHGERIELRREKIAPADSTGKFSVTHDFDPVSYGVYEGALEFSVEIEGECEIDSFNISIPKLKQADNGEISTDFDGNLVKIYDLDGCEKWIPCAPQRVLFMGNSILVGMFFKYGMCASSSKTDYAYLVSSEILKRSPECRFEKLYSSPLEHSVSVEDYEKWFSEEDNIMTGKRVCESLTFDLDLVIIQLTDNVNTPEKAAIFPENADRLIREIKTRSPRARIIWVYGWYSGAETSAMVHKICRPHHIETVNVSALHTRENEAYLGQISEGPDGNDFTVKDYWISHPGDKGMAEIADSIVKKIFQS